MSRYLAAVAFCICAILPFFRGGAPKASPSKRAEAPQNSLKLVLRAQRSSPSDLEISGNLAGQPSGAKYYLSRDDLLRLHQVNFSVSGDPNFSGPTKVKGVELASLARALAVEGEKALIVAVCDDWYRAYYSQQYRQLHQPVLVLELDGQPPEGWPKSKNGLAMAYLITHPNFVPSSKTLSQEEEAQVPWGVIRLEFHDEQTEFTPISPRSRNAADAAVQSGYTVARQNCLRCHGPESQEHLKGKLTWDGIALFASQAPQNFAAYVRNPKALSKEAQMPGNPNYDDATIAALIAYFRTFISPAQR